MPIFKEGNQLYDVPEEYMADFAKHHPDAYAILENTEGKKYKVRASKYFKFQADQMHFDPANPFPTSTIEDSPYKEDEQRVVQQAAQTATRPTSIPSVPSPLKKEEPEGGLPGVTDFKTFSEEHPMGMNLSSDAKIPFKTEEKLTTSYQEAIPAEELAMAKAEAALQAEYDKKAVQQIEEELADVNAKLAVMEKEYFNSADYLKYMAVSGMGRAAVSMLPGGTLGGALAFKDPFMFAPKELIDLQKKKTALMQAKEHKAVADEINKNNDYEGKSFRWDNIVTGAKQWGKETLRSFDPSYRSTELLIDKVSIGNKVANGEELSAEEKDMLTVYALEDMMEQKYGSAKGDYGYIAGYAAPMMLEFMLQLAVSPGKGLAKASMTGAEKYAAKVTKNLIKKYGATAVRKNLLRAAAYTAKQTARLAGAGANSVIVAHTSQAPALVEGVAERMAGKAIGERDEQGNVIGTSFIDRKSPTRAIYEQEATMAIENFTETMFEGLGVGKMVSGAMSKAGGKLAGTKLGQKLVSSKGASYMAELMEKTSSTEWYKAFDKIRKAGHLGNAPEELLEEYAVIPLRHGMGVAETDMTMFEELTDPETFYSIAAGLSLGMGGMTMLQAAPALVSTGSDLIDYSRRKYFATSADKALHHADIGGASVFGEEWAYITPAIEAFTEEEIGNGMTQLINAQPTAEKKQAILNYMEALQEYRGANTMFEKMKQERIADDKKLAAIEARKEGYSMINAQEIAAVKRRMEQMSSLYGQELEDIISQYAEPYDFLRSIEGKVSEGTFAIATEYINLKETYGGILDRMRDDTEARILAMRNRVQSRTNKQTGNIITAQIADEQGNVATDEMGNPLSFYVVDAYLTINDGAVSMPSEGSVIVRGRADDKMQMLPASRIVNPIAQNKEAVEALITEFEGRIRTEEQMRNEAELSGVDPVEVESEAQEAASEEMAVQESPAPTRSAEQIAVELTKTESGQELKELIDQYVRTDEDPEHVEQQIMAEYPEHAELAMEYYHSLTAPAVEEAAPNTAEGTTPTVTEGAAPATEAPAVPTPHVIRNKDNDLDVDAMIANGVTPEQMAEDLTAEFSSADPGLALSTAQEYLAQVQEERAKTKSIIAKNCSLRKKEQFWSNVVGILTPQAEVPVTETPQAETPQAETPQAEVPAEAQNANAKWQAAPKVYGRETTLRVKGMRLRGRYVVAPAGVATGSHTADFEDNADFIHDEQGRSRNPRKYNLAANQAAVIEGSGKFALENVQVVSPHGIVYDGSGRQAMGDRAARQGTDGIYMEDLMDRADEFGFAPEQIQGMEHPRVYFEVAPGQLDYSAQTFDKFNAPEMKAPSAVELGAAMGQVLSDETFNRLADTIKQSGGLSAVYKSKPLQEAIAYILRDASDVKDVTTATLPQYYNADTRTLTEAGRNLLEACLLGKIFADNPQVLALLPKLPNKVMSKVAQAMPELAANMQMGEYALKDELANALTLVYEASQSGTSVNDYATQQDWTKGGSATDLFGKTVVMLAKALNGEIEGAELADVVRAYNVKAVDVVTGQGSMFENPTREQMLQEVINYYMKGEVATQEEEVATQEEEVATEESIPQQEPQEITEKPKTRTEKVNAMSDEEFNALLASNDLEAMRTYEQELHAMRGIDKAEREEYNRRSAKLAAIKAEFGEFDNAPASVRNEYLKMSEEIEAKYSVDKVVERQDKLSTRIFEVEAQRAREEEQREKEEKENYRKTAHNGFLAEKTPMGAAKADKALNKQYRVDGKVNTVAGFIEAWNEEGPMELKVYENGNKTTYLVNGHDFGKTAYDYALYLQSKKQPEATSKEASSSSDSSISEKVETARGMLKEYDKAHAEWVDAVDNARDREAATESYIQKQKDFRTFLMTLSEEELETVSSIDSTAEEEVKKEERRRHHQAELAEDYEKALSSQGEITPVAPKAKGSIFDATVKDETRPVFGGVYHKGGTAVATDGKILIEEKGAYEQEKEGQLVDKKGNVIEGQRFPNWRGVTPKDVEAFGVSMESLRSFVEGVRQDAKKNGKKEADVTVVVKLPNGNFAYFELPHLVKFTNAAYRLGATELMLSPREEAPLLVQTEKGTAMLMPLLRASEEMYAYEISGKETEETAPAEQKAYAERVREHMRKKATELAEKLHLPVEIIESEEEMAKLKGKKAKAKGWYEVSTGKIVLVLPNNESVADIVETVLHEGVAHLGLRKLFGKQFTQFLDNVYNHAEQSIREKIDETARKNKVSTRTATEEYLASLAETTDFENINAKWWSQIKKFFLDMLHTIGFDYKGGTISDSELRYILWRSHENLKEPNPRFNVSSQAKDIVKQNKLKAEEKQAKERRRILSLGKTDSNPLVADRVNEEETLYRMGDANNPNETAQRVYNEEMLSARFLARETMVDYLAALDSLQRIIAEKGGKITSFQDAYSRMLALSSRNKQEIDLFDYSVMPELTKAIGEILGRTGKINWESPAAKTLQRYTKVKHGIERDRDMAVRKALPAIADMKFKEQFAEINQRIEESTLRSEYEALIKERADMRANPAKYGLLTAEQIEGSLEAEWYKRTGEIRAEEGTWKEKQQKMDNAIAEVFGLDQVGLNAFGLDLTEDYSGITETLVNEGLLTRKEVRKDRYAARKKAYEFVEQYEEQIGQAKADRLWNAIKAVSGFALEKQRQGGLVSAKYVADCNKRFEFYVPLRGFNDEVAHDVYDYLDDVYNNNNPVQTAEGRESEAGNPFANLMNIGYRSITAGNHNLAVQAFWNLANRKDVKGFLVPSRVWHLSELTPEQQDFVREILRGIADLSNDDILPYLPDNASAEEIQDLLDDFEETMKSLKAMGYAYQGSRKAKQELRTLSKAEENAHRVKVYMNGEARYVTIVGNPRVAQALNGQLNPEQADWAALKGLQNFLAGAFTSQNPSFALANLVRDTQHANMRAFITENPKYWGTLTKKQAKFWRLGAIMKMLAAYENSIGNTGRHGWGGTLDHTDETHMRFKRFMEQGGATGFTFSRKQHENLEKLAKMAENVEGKSAPGRGFVVGEFFDAIRTFTEASELVNRFAAYETSLEMGRTEQQAIRDAKEITLNFNRKGAGRATYNASRASGNKAYTNAKYSAVNGLANLSQYGRDNLIFWNASVQGAYQLWSMLKKHPVKTLIAYGAVPYTLAAFGLPILNALLCGGDDDKYYYELPEYERQRNICIKIPGTKGWFKIPLDPATQKIWAMGEATGAVMRGKKELNLWNDIGANFVGLFSPVDIYWGDKNQNIVQRALSVGSSFTPTLAQPLLHTFANRDWKGKPLENDSRYLDHLPSYKKAFKSDKASLTELSKWMNTWANGDADTYKVGPFDFASPGVMEELLFGYTGGYGQAALAAVETAWSLVSDEARGKFQWDKQPIINRFWVEGNPGQTKRTVFMNYNKEVGDFMEEVEQRRSAISRDIKNAAIKQDDTGYGEAVAAREKFFNSEDWKKYAKLKAADAQVRQEAKGGIENASDITISAMLEAIEMIHDDKAFEANEQ